MSGRLSNISWSVPKSPVRTNASSWKGSSEIANGRANLRRSSLPRVRDERDDSSRARPPSWEVSDRTIGSPENRLNGRSSPRAGKESAVPLGVEKIWRVDNGRCIRRAKRDERREIKGERESRAGPGSCKAGVVAGREGPAQAPPGKWRHKRPHGRRPPPMARLRGRDGVPAEKERRREGGREGGGVRRGRVGGCKCPRDVSDRCGSIQTPHRFTTRPKNVLRDRDELRLSFSFRRNFALERGETRNLRGSESCVANRSRMRRINRFDLGDDRSESSKV